MIIVPSRCNVVMVDNYLISVELFEYLKANNIYACGAVRSSRKFLSKLKDDKKMKQGDFNYCTTDKRIVFYKWKDNKCVHLCQIIATAK